MVNKKLKEYHRFLDESGDTTFFGKRNKMIVGENGVSLSFIIGMVKFKSNLDDIRNQVINLQKEIEEDEYYKDIPSIKKSILKGGYFFHAKNDIPEIREKFFRFIKSIDCSFEAIVARKIPDLYQRKHESKETVFYADLLSHLLKNKLEKHEKLVLNIASRGKCTKNNNLELALNIAQERFIKTHPEKTQKTKVVFNITEPTKDPLVNVADYFCWTIQNVFEKGKIRYYNFLKEQISLVVDLYDFENYNKKWANYYRLPKNPLTSKNKLSPPTH